MKRPELLSPAGNMESLKYAVAAGCDAVYFGGKHFGARAFANNFSDDEIIEAIKYCHLLGVKVYVTVNTLIHDEEVNDFLSFIDFLHCNNVDAILLQDIGMFDLIHKTYPNLELHVSTQMHIHNLDGALLMKKLGAKRIVLARETPIEIIKEIKAKVNAEIEVFVHGSLCISYSGQCLLGYYLDNRSGNRGQCSGACRQTYEVVDNNNHKINQEDYPLSTKDLCTIESIDQLIESGIDSLKIEGRMKSPEYVYAVVSLYKEAIDSYCETGKIIINQKKLNELKKIYNRSYTKGFIFNESNNDFINMSRPNHQGVSVGKVIDYVKPFVTILLTDDIKIGSGLRIISEKSDVGVLLNEFFIKRVLVKEAHAGDIVSFKVHDEVIINSPVLITKDVQINDKIKTIVNQSLRKIKIDVTVRAKLNEDLYVTFNDGTNIVVAFGNLITSSISKPITIDDITDKLSKLGNTVYKINNISVDLDNNVFINVGELNELRRKLVTDLDNKRLYKTDYKKQDYYMNNLIDYPKTRLKTVLLEKNEQLKKLTDKYDVIYSECVIKDTVLKLPQVIYEYPTDDKKYLISELGGLNVLKTIDTDSSLNVFNAYSVALLHSLGVNKITLSRELSYDDIQKLVDNYLKSFNKHPNLEVIINSHLELMVSKFSLNDYYNNDKIKLIDYKKESIIIKKKDNLMYLYSSKIIKDYHDYYRIGVNSVRNNIIDE